MWLLSVPSHRAQAVSQHGTAPPLKICLSSEHEANTETSPSSALRSLPTTTPTLPGTQILRDRPYQPNRTCPLNDPFPAWKRWETFSPGDAACSESGSREGSGQCWNTNIQYQSHQDLIEHPGFLSFIPTRLNFISLILIMEQNQDLELY